MVSRGPILRAFRSFTSLAPCDQGFINGKWVRSHDGSTFPVCNPSNGEFLTSVADMSTAETRGAIECAKIAFGEWKLTPAQERATILKRWRELILQNRDELARIITLEQGKPLGNSLGEVDLAMSFVEYFAEEAIRISGDIIPSTSRTSRVLITKEPVGVCGAITPWNFPMAMLLRKASPALAVGCCVVSKPAEDTPVSALVLAKLAHDAGVPDGVLNVVTSSAKHTPAVGKELCENPDISTISFTGSVDVGKILLAQSASTVKKMCLELGGNSAFIVFETADIDAAVEGAMISKFRNTGQTCIASNRFYAHDSVYDEFTTKLMTAMKEQLVMGDGFKPGANIGPLINQGAVNKVNGLIEDALSKGAKISIGGPSTDTQGNFYEPTIVRDVTDDMSISQLEVFGPVVAIRRFHNETDVISSVNSSRYGLASYFYSTDYKQIWRVAEALEVGMVAVNEGTIASSTIPAGGVKESGLGREGSRYGVDDYIELKCIRFGGL